MNVIISNRYSEMLTNLNIDIIKNVRGEYEPEVIIANFENFFFNKMILDITAVIGYKNIATIQKLASGLDMNKVIVLLDDSPEVNSPSYLSGLVSMGIYNFTRNIDSIEYLINNPNYYVRATNYNTAKNLNGEIKVFSGKQKKVYLKEKLNCDENTIKRISIIFTRIRSNNGEKRSC